MSNKGGNEDIHPDAKGPSRQSSTSSVVVVTPPKKSQHTIFISSGSSVGSPIKKKTKLDIKKEQKSNNKK